MSPSPPPQRSSWLDPNTAAAANGGGLPFFARASGIYTPRPLTANETLEDAPAPPQEATEKSPRISPELEPNDDDYNIDKNETCSRPSRSRELATDPSPSVRVIRRSSPSRGAIRHYFSMAEMPAVDENDELFDDVQFVELATAAALSRAREMRAQYNRGEAAGSRTRVHKPPRIRKSAKNRLKNSHSVPANMNSKLRRTRDWVYDGQPESSSSSSSSSSRGGMASSSAAILQENRRPLRPASSAGDGQERNSVNMSDRPETPPGETPSSRSSNAMDWQSQSPPRPEGAR